MKTRIAPKILSREDAAQVCREYRNQGKTVVFTNGCFDILHAGHADYLAWAAGQGDILVVGLNSDSSVRRNKGSDRPVVNQDDRAAVMAALEKVDHVVIFDEDEPADLIAELVPNVLVKGEDWAHYVSGREVVETNGGRVALAPLTEGRSTSALIDKIVSTYARDKE